MATLLKRPGGAAGVETVNDKDAYICLVPETRILGADLAWTTAGEVREGDRLAGFDEQNGQAREGLRAPKRYRRWRLCTVSGVRRVIKPCYRLTFDDGTTVIASEDHLWLGGSHCSGGRGWRWVSTKGMVCDRATQRSWALKMAPTVEREESWEAGWLAGFFDGEGSVSGGGWKLTVTQNPGEALERAERLLRDRGFSVTRHDREGRASALTVGGGMREVLRFLMLVRPERLIANAVARLESRSLYGREHHAVGLVSKEFVGKMEVVAIETDSRTFVAEGLASHNCNFWRAVQHAPEAVASYADGPVNECDLFARHLWLVNSGRERIAALEADPDHYDAKVAGWWVWGVCSWIGSGWCSGKGPWKLPHLGDPGQGVNRNLPHLGDPGRGYVRTEAVYEWMAGLSARLRRVRVACGDWSRVVTPSVLRAGGWPCGAFLDPPYDTGSENYSTAAPGIAAEVREWALAHGDDDRLRIVLCGYDGEGEMPASWHCHAYSATGAYVGKGTAANEGRHRERLWFSPHCLPVDLRHVATQAEISGPLFGVAE